MKSHRWKPKRSWKQLRRELRCLRWVSRSRLTERPVCSPNSKLSKVSLNSIRKMCSDCPREIKILNVKTTLNKTFEMSYTRKSKQWMRSLWNSRTFRNSYTCGLIHVVSHNRGQMWMIILRFFRRSHLNMRGMPMGHSRSIIRCTRTKSVQYFHSLVSSPLKLVLQWAWISIRPPPRQTGEALHS